MAVSQTQKNEMYQFFAVAFDAAPGVTYMNQLMDAANSGMTTLQIVNVFTTKPQFLSIYPLVMSPAVFGASIIENVVGNTASQAAKDAAAAEMAAAINSGMTRGDAVYYLFTNLMAKSTSDAVWGQTKVMFDKQLIVSKYYTEVMLEGAEPMPLLSSLQKAISQVTPTSDVSTPAAIQAVITSAPGYSQTLTVNQDNLTGSIYGDTFFATQNTLQLGDAINGNLGDDTLSLTIGGSGGLITGFATTSVENIKVKSLSTSDSTLDLSDVQGPVTLGSYETDGASLTFHDIQSINATNIVVVDTNESHTYQYDVGNSASNNDVAEIAVQEMRLGSAITLENNNTPGESFVDQIDLNSAVRADPGVQPSNTFKNDMALVAGEDLDTLNITGDADLLITNVLDENISLVDARTHTGAQGVNSEVQNIIGNWWELELDLSNSNDGSDMYENDGNVPTMTLWGSQGDNHIEFGSTNNDKVVVLQGGNDWLRTGTGEASAELGSGNDSMIAGALNDSVNAGSGNDVITDAGSNYEGYKNEGAEYYVPDFWAGGNYYDLAGGNDSLTVTPESMQGSGQESAAMYGYSLNTVIGGTGNDVITINGSAYPAWNGDNFYNLTGYNSVDLGDGNDRLTVGNKLRGNSTDDTGHNSVVGGIGNDSIGIWQDGDQSIDAGEGNDSVQVGGFGTGSEPADYSNGNHTIELGAGNDSLTVWGTSNTQDGVTTINAGSDNDYIYIEKDHVLLADLGHGADRLQMRARDLMAEDTIVGGNTGGVDAIYLSNVGGDTTTGLVRRSETSRTSQIEQYWLQDSGIRLDLTDRMFETAEGNSITVSTTESTPTPSLLTGYFNGMSYDAWDAAGGWSPNGSPAADYIQIQHTDLNAPNDGLGPVYFLYTNELLLTQTVDMTAITVPDFYFTLLGGSLRDILYGNDATINGHHTLDFDSAPDSTLAWNPKDTLVVVDGAEITTADMRKVTNLERIELQATSNTKQDWHIELNTRVINQTTGREKLYIIVDPEVAAGSRLYINVGEDGWAGADTDVIVVRNSNIQVWVNGDLVTSPEYGTKVAAFNSAFGLYVETDYLFTTNTDNLIGDGGPNTFYAASIDQIQSSDQADGNGGDDTVQLGFGLAAGNSPIASQLNNVTLYDIETLWFDTENEVQADGFENPYTAAFMNAWATSLQTVVTGSGEDHLSDMNRSGLTWNLDGANDFISFDALVHGDYLGNGDESGMDNGDGSTTLYDFYATVDGGAGHDTVQGADNEWQQGSGATGNDLTLSHVEEVYTYAGDDTIRFNENSGNTTVWTGSGFDYVYLDQDGTAGVVDIDDAEVIYGGSGSDTVDVDVDQGSLSQYGGYQVSVYGYGSADSINVYGQGSGQIMVDGGTGNDTIEIDTDNSPGTYVTAEGGTGDDHITVGGNTPDYVTVWGDVEDGWEPKDVFSAPIDGGTGADTIDVRADESAWVDGQQGNDSIKVQSDDVATVYGGTGNDWIQVNTDGNQMVWGEDGNDTILGISGGSDNWIYGGEDNDAIAVAGTGMFSIVGGAGNDTISLGNDTATGADHLDVEDYVIFGDIDYDALQVENQNTQGRDRITGFVFETYQPGGDPLPNPQDLMDFTDFLGDAWINPDNMVWIPGTWTQGSTVNASPVVGNSIVVLSSNSTPSLTAMDFSVNLANTIQLNDNGRAVVVVGTNQTGSGSGISEFDVWYVQDVDSGAGQTWDVVQVADVLGATRVGISEVLDNLLGGMTVNPVVLQDDQIIDVQSNSDDFTIEWFDHELDGIQVLNFDADSGSEDKLDFFDGSDNWVWVGNLSTDVTVVSNTVYSMHSETPANVVVTGNPAGDQLLITEGVNAILVASTGSQFATTANVYHMYDATSGAGVSVGLDLIGTINLSTGQFWNINTDNFV